MSDKAQTRLLTVLTLAVFELAKGPVSKLLLAEKVPGKRGASEDAMDATVQAVLRMGAVILASAFVRQLANQRR